MKTNYLITVLLFSTIVSYSQSNSIVGSWIWRDSTSAIQIFIKSNGTIDKRTALASENIWSKSPKTGNYTFKYKHALVIKWADESVEIIEIKFKGNNAEFQYYDVKDKLKKSYTFIRIVDEEVRPDK